MKNNTNNITPVLWTGTRLTSKPSAWVGLEDYLYPIIKKYNLKCDTALEFGVEHGYSTYLLSQIFNKVVAVDTFEGDIHTKFQDLYEETLSTFKEIKNTSILKSDFREFIKQNDNLYDLIHIDIVHTYDDTYECAEWSIKHSSVVLLHDTVSYPDINRVCVDLANKYQLEYYNIPHHNGLGILYNPQIRKRSNINVFYHCHAVNHWKELFEKTYNSIDSSGLINEIDSIFVNFDGKDYKFFNKFDKVKLIKSKEQFTSEASTLDLVHDHSLKNDGYSLYLHGKGVRYIKDLLYDWDNYTQVNVSANVDSWVDYLLYYNVELWKSCISKLEEGYDCVGTEYVKEHKHYAGNFWWVNNKYIRTLDKVNPTKRQESELWITHYGSANYYNFMNLNLENLYTSNLTPTMYKNPIPGTPKFHFITRCSRPKNLQTVGNSIFNKDTANYDLVWHVLFDESQVKEIPTSLLRYLLSLNCKIYYKQNRQDYLHTAISEVVETILDGYIHIIDDDNILHPEYLPILTDQIQKDAQPLIYLYEQKVDGKDFTGLDVRVVGPEYVKVSKIDMGQFTAHCSLITENIPTDYVGDGILLEKMYNQSPEKFKFINKVLCYYNYLQTLKEEPTYHLPRISVIGHELARSLKSSKMLDYWEDRLVVESYLTDKNITDKLISFNPDAIITIGESFLNFPEMTNKSLTTRAKWIHLGKEQDLTGDLAYDLAMISMLRNDTSTLISFFTPTYNTGTKLWNTYNSLKNQTYSNWEWVVVDDSSDSGYTYDIARQIASIDERVKVYSFKEKSKGIIGESKYRAACLCTGEILAELDHDDIVLEHMAEYLNEAQQTHPQVGFFYSDCIEVDENYNSLTYPEGFAFGYGSYYDFEWKGKVFKAAKECNINPKTIRHIVSVPNHIRAWRRSTYFQIGGHNRRLTIADDYELIVRTFLNTTMCRIAYPGYLQFIYENQKGTNTHNATRADIQRRVWSISNFYNGQIVQRFKQLGVVDWAHEENPKLPIWANSKYGDLEGSVNIEHIPSNSLLKKPLEPVTATLIN